MHNLLVEAVVIIYRVDQ